VQRRIVLAGATVKKIPINPFGALVRYCLDVYEPPDEVPFRKENPQRVLRIVIDSSSHVSGRRLCNQVIQIREMGSTQFCGRVFDAVSVFLKLSQPISQLPS
jgi:hypothetical protein